MSARKSTPKYLREQVADLDRRLERLLTQPLNPAEREFIELMRSVLQKSIK